MALDGGDKKSEAVAGAAAGRNARRWAHASLALILLPIAVSVLLVARWEIWSALILQVLVIPGVVCAHVALRRLRRNSGIELTVAGVRTLGYIVLVVWALFGVTAVPGLIRFPRERFDREMRGCYKRLSVFGSSVELYAANHDGRLPPGETALEVFSVLLEEAEPEGILLSGYAWPAYVCPGAVDDWAAWLEQKELSEETCSYALVAGVGMDSPKDFIMLYDKSVENHRMKGGWWIRNRPEGRKVCYTSGEDYFAVGWLDEEEFQERMEWQKEMMGRMEEGGEYVEFEGWAASSAR